MNIDEKIAQLKQELEQIMAEANRQIGFRQGQIALLEEMKKEQAKPDETKIPEQNMKS